LIEMNAELDLCAQPRVADEIDWSALYADQLPRVYNYMRYRVGDGPVAEDLTAATFEKAWRGRKQYRRDRAAFSTWLFTIARNVAIDHFRRQRPAVPLETISQRPDGVSVEETVQRRADLDRLGALLDALSRRERDVVSLKYGAGLTNRSIASLTDLSESNVGTILYRVVRRLREQWESEP
jgi:RNA polymerase sigma-70 factor (ECF subfamily)